MASTNGTVIINAAGNLSIGNTASPSFADIEGGGSIVLTAGGNLTIDNDSLISAHGTGGITAAAGGSISVLHTSISPTILATQGGPITLSTGAGGTLTINGGNPVSIQTTRNGGNGSITISADHVVVAATDGITAGTGIVGIQPVTATEPIQLGTTTDAELDLSAAELGKITAGTLRVGAPSDKGNLTVTAGISLPSVSTLSLQTAGAVSDSASVDTTTVPNLAVSGGAGISLDTTVTNVAFRNTSGGSVRIANTGPTTITAVDMLNGTAGNEVGNLASGATTLLASGPLTFAIDTISAGTLTAATADAGGTRVDNISINLAVDVESTGGDVVLQAGDDVIINHAASLAAPGGNIDLRSGFGDTDNEGIIIIGGQVSAYGTVAINVGSTNSASPIGTNAVSESPSGGIRAWGLLLLNLGPAGGNQGSFVLNTGANAVGTLAATTSAPIRFLDGTGLSVGVVTSPNEGVSSFGIFTDNHDATLRAGGNLTFSQEMYLGTGSAVVSAAAAILNGQASGANIGAGSLALESAAGIGATAAITTVGLGALRLAFSNSMGPVNVSNTGPLTMVALSSIDPTSVQGGSSNSGKTTTLAASGPITFAAAVSSAGTLAASTTDTPAVHSENITVNAGVSVLSTGADVLLEAGDDLVINGTVTAPAPVGNIDLRSGFGDVDGEGTITMNGTLLAGATAALNVQVSNANEPSGTNAVTEGSTGAIAAPGLLLLDFAIADRPFALDSSTNNAVGTIAATTQGDIRFRNGAALSVGTVTSPDEGVTSFGIFTNSHAVTLSSDAGGMAVDQAINSGAGSLVLSVGNATVGNTLAVNAALTATGGITFNGGNGSDTFQLNFVSGAKLTGPVTINSGGRNDVIALNCIGPNPLPARVALNGVFTLSGLSGANPLANTTLDIGTSTLFISYAAGADPIAAIRTYLKNGYNNGGWNGASSISTGVITSLAAQGDPLHNTAIGIADSADGSGINPTANTVELKYTIYGDANLDGTANLADLLILTRHFGQSLGWDGGDFNYDGTANLADFLTLTRHFGQVAPASPALTDIIAKPTNRSAARRVSV